MLRDLKGDLHQKFFEMSRFEKEAYDSGCRYVCGVDEAGRGPLAGPVVAAACFLPHDVVFLGLDDSKKMSPEKRKKMQELLLSDDRVVYGIGVVDAQTIDEINIFQATKEAMRRAVSSCPVSADLLLVDGLKLDDHIVGIPSRKIIKGDTLSVSIAAASVLAKEHRDALMLVHHREYPEYGFDKHKGYGTAVHFEALEKFGVTPIHRKTFSPVARALDLKGLYK